MPRQTLIEKGGQGHMQKAFFPSPCLGAKKIVKSPTTSKYLQCRGRHMKELSENEVLAQLEEAYARATVALTRAQKLCIIMGPLDMRGLPGAATVIGCPKYGAGVCGVHDSNQAAEVFLKDGSLNDGPDDDAFLQSLRRSLKTARGAYPPVALAEIYQEFKSPLTMIRRLHLMVVDLDRSRSVSSQVYRDFMNCRGSLDPVGSLNTLPVPLSGQEVPYQTRFVFAYGMDNSDRPCYLLWPIRGGNGQFLLVDPWSGNYFDLEAAKFVKPIGIEHFFDAFSLEKKRPLKIDAASALNIQVKDVSDSLVVNQDKATRFELTPVWAPAEPPAKRAKTAEVRLSSASNVPRPPKSDENEKGSSEEEDRGRGSAKGIGGVVTGMREKVDGGGKWRRTSEPAREWEVVNRLNAEGYPRQRRSSESVA